VLLQLKIKLSILIFFKLQFIPVIKAESLASPVFSVTISFRNLSHCFSAQ